MEKFLRDVWANFLTSWFWFQAEDLGISGGFRFSTLPTIRNKIHIFNILFSHGRKQYGLKDI
jgi:hypothetical protein